ncbi:piggyBac transposable element-derived protein 4-like [Hyposmocoma kahamanoa]|uniref:piggyBac transposable element-derived protein 4-like n=1 Tax=Hyposmocoma kahamanoa TaxID=1477025 RepID=UPI000E6D7678|nr:piggyBac transposable element-derived protein 4-like [Hyposmocoma kahamanoa]
MSNEICEEILKWTNAEIAIRKQSYENITSTQKETNKEELNALFGVLLLAAALKDNHLTSDELFNTSFCGTRYIDCMSRERFDFLIRCLRFDDRTIRIQTLQSDPFTPIRKIWDLLIVQCRDNYIPGTNVTIDEQLLAFRGRCKFKTYIPKKPAKYGLKIEMMCDSGTRYMIDAMPYLGKRTHTGDVPLGEYVVKEFTRSIRGSNRNVTTDNWFTSVPLAKNLLQQPYKLTIVGTLRANKTEIPEEMKNYRGRAIGTAMFCYNGPLTLLSFKPKPSNIFAVVL